MKTHQKLAQILRILTLCAFALPFFYTGCMEKKEEAGPEVEIDSSTAVIEEPLKTQIDSSTTATDTSVAVVQNDNTESKERALSSELSLKYPLLRPFLESKEHTFSGLAMILDLIPFLGRIAFFVAFLLFIMGYIITYFDSQAIISVFIIDGTALAFLLFANPVSFNCERLWGAWVCYVLAVLLVFYDLFFIIKKSNALHKNQEH